MREDLSDMASVYLNPGGQFWVVVLDRAIVGMVAVEVVDRDRGVMELRRMSVAPIMKKRGLGSRLVRLVENYAAQHGSRELRLSTGSIMWPARALYTRNGFEAYKVESKTSEAMRDAGQEFSVVHFRKPITSAHGRWVWSECIKSGL